MCYNKIVRWPPSNFGIYTVKPVHTGMPWGQTFIPVWTGSCLERVLLSGGSNNDNLYNLHEGYNSGCFVGRSTNDR